MIDILGQGGCFIELPIDIYIHLRRIVRRKSTCHISFYNQSGSFEREGIYIIYGFLYCKFIAHFQILKSYFQSNRSDVLPSDYEVCSYLPVSILLQHLAGMSVRHVIGFIQTDIRIGERYVFYFIQSFFPGFGDVAVSYHGSQDACG